MPEIGINSAAIITYTILLGTDLSFASLSTLIDSNALEVTIVAKQQQQQQQEEQVGVATALVNLLSSN
ncbi:MAG: hypothetical protein WCI60_04460 [bacterium]